MCVCDCVCVCMCVSVLSHWCMHINYEVCHAHMHTQILTSVMTGNCDEVCTAA